MLLDLLSALFLAYLLILHQKLVSFVAIVTHGYRLKVSLGVFIPFKIDRDFILFLFIARKIAILLFLPILLDMCFKFLLGSPSFYLCYLFVVHAEDLAQVEAGLLAIVTSVEDTSIIHCVVLWMVVMLLSDPNLAFFDLSLVAHNGLRTLLVLVLESLLCRSRG